MPGELEDLQGQIRMTAEITGRPQTFQTVADRRGSGAVGGRDGSGRFRRNQRSNTPTDRRSADGTFVLLRREPASVGTGGRGTGLIFSPLHDRNLPENIHGLLLGGGYPELYAGQS